METLPVKPTKNLTKKKHTSKLKVVYISSPMKVKTSASKFRALVQELTGRDSDISRYDVSYFDPVAPAAMATTTSAQGGSVDAKVVQCGEQGMNCSSSSESLLDDVFGVDQLMFPSYSLYESPFPVNRG